MLLKRATLVLFIYSLLSFSCNSSGDNKFDDSEDSTHEHADSADLLADACYLNFFKGLKRFPDSTSAYLITDTNRVTLTQYFRDEFMSPMSSYGLKDLDNDGKEELIIYNNTGGAHCCDEFTIFTRISPLDFKFTSRLMGDVCIEARNNIITFSFGESLGYFFSCYACTFSDSTTSLKPIRALRLRYHASSLEIVPYSREEEMQNLTNLEVLSKHGYEKLEGMTDNGWRKEFAINTALWHFNHQKDWKSTKTLFDKYYHFSDHSRVWNELYQSILETGRENSF